jgi:hypothetical protein
MTMFIYIIGIVGGIGLGALLGSMNKGAQEDCASPT